MKKQFGSIKLSPEDTRYLYTVLGGAPQDEAKSKRIRIQLERQKASGFFHKENPK